MPSTCRDKTWEVYESIGVDTDTFVSYKSEPGVPIPKTSDEDLIKAINARAKAQALEWSEAPIVCDGECKDGGVTVDWVATFKQEVGLTYKEGKYTYRAHGTVEYDKGHATRRCLPKTDKVVEWQMVFGGLKVKLPAGELAELAPELMSEIESRLKPTRRELAGDNPLLAAGNRIGEIDISDYFKGGGTKPRGTKGRETKGRETKGRSRGRRKKEK